MKKSILFIFLSFLICNAYSQDGDLNMTIVAHVPSPSGGSGIWHFVDKNGIEYAALGTKNSLVIYSLEQPDKPIERARINGVNTIWREAYAYKNHIYAVTDNRSDGVIIVNMENAPNNITSKFWTTNITTGGQTADITTCHTVFVDEKGVLCLNGCTPWRGVLFFDVNQDPENPKFLGSETKRYSHDVYMRGDTLWSSDILDGVLSIWDVKDKINPVEMATVRTPFAFTHNSWISDDAKYVFTTDERNDAYVASYDVSDMTNIRLLDEWRPKDTEGTGVIPHNTRYLNGYLITAYYTDGVKIIDAHRPDNLIEVGSVDTYFGNEVGFHGCWGVSPYLPSGTIVASDIEGGLFVIRPEYVRACYLEGRVSDSLTDESIANATIIIKTPRKNLEQSNLKGEYKTGYATAGTYEVTYSHPDYLPATYDVELQNGVLTVKNVKLIRVGSVTQRIVVKDKKTLQTIEGAHYQVHNSKRTVEGVTDVDGANNFTVTLDLEEYEIVVGKWGYLHKLEMFNSLSPSQEIVVLLDKGYQDDFLFDLGWTVSGNATTGQWIREEPLGTLSGTNVFQTEFDVIDDYGIQCYVTGNSSTDAATDDVDGGNTIVVSPFMDLSTYNEPLFNYSYWFNNGGGNNTPNDKMSFKLITGTDTFLVRQITSPASEWKKETGFKVKTLTQDLDSVRFLVETADDAPGHLVEAALDAFLVTEGSPVKTEYGNQLSSIKVYPTHFNKSTFIDLSEFEQETIEIRIRNLYGHSLESHKMESFKGRFEIGNSLPTGIYFVDVKTSSGKTGSQKIVKMTD